MTRVNSPASPVQTVERSRSTPEDPGAPSPGTEAEPPKRPWSPHQTRGGEEARRLQRTRGFQVPLQGSVGVAAGPLNLAVAGAVSAHVSLSKKSELIKSNADRQASTDLHWSRVSVAGAVAIGVGRGAEPLSPPDEAPIPGAPPAGGEPGPPPKRGLELSPGATLGFSAAFQMVAIVPSKGLAAVPKTQLEALRFDLGAAAVSKLPAGSEFAISGQPANVAVGPSFGGSVDGGILQAQLGASATVSESRGAYLKHVVVERGGKVTVTVRRFDERALALAAGATAGVGGDDWLLGGAAQRAALQEATGEHRGQNLIVDGSGGGLGRAGLTVGARRVEEEGVCLRRAFDLGVPAERSAYEALMRAPPSELGSQAGDVRRRLEEQGAGTAYHGRVTESGVSANAYAGPFSALRLEARDRSREGTPFELESKDPGGSTAGRADPRPPLTTHLRSEEHERSVAGALPRLLGGADKAVRVGVHEAAKDGRAPERRASFVLEVASPRVSEAEARQLESLVAGQGTAASQRGEPVQASGGGGAKSGRLRLELEVPSRGLERLQALDAKGLEAALVQARERVGLAPLAWRSSEASRRSPHYANEGSPSFSPPSVAERFAQARRDWGSAEDSGGAEAQRVHGELQRDYAATTGRSLESDLRAAEVVRELGSRVAATRGQPLEAWRPVLSLLGGLDGADLGAAIALLRELAGAKLQGLELELGGETLARQGELSPAVLR